MTPNKTKSVDDVIKELSELGKRRLIAPNGEFIVIEIPCAEDAISYLQRAKVMEVEMKAIKNAARDGDETNGTICLIYTLADGALQQFKGGAK